MYQNSSFQSHHDMRMSSGLHATLEIYINLPTLGGKKELNCFLKNDGYQITKSHRFFLMIIFFPSEDRREVKSHLL